MKSININELRFMDLEPLKTTSIGGNIYFSDSKVYKLFKTDNKDIILNKKRKIEILSLMQDFLYASLPVEKIVDGFFKKTLKGYSMDRDPRGRGITLDKLSTSPDLSGDYLLALKNASLHLKSTHEREEKIILGDASFSNVIVYPNQEGRYADTKFVDFDSIQLGALPADASSKLLRFYYFYKRFPLVYGKFYKSMDKISYLLHFFYSIFGEDILRINPYDYDELSEQVNTLYRLRPTFYLLRNCSGIPDVYYLHEVIDLKDAPVLSKLLVK